MTIDKTRCMALHDDERGKGPLAALGGRRCGAPATHITFIGRCCTRHAEELRSALRSKNSLVSVIAGKSMSEEDIARLVQELPS